MTSPKQGSDSEPQSSRLPPWWNKKEKPRYVGEEREFARANNLRPNPSSGRFGIHKGDSRSPIQGTPSGFRFAVDNKGTKRLTYTIDSRWWRGYRKASELGGRAPALVVAFYGVDRTRDSRRGDTVDAPYGTADEEIVIIPRKVFEAMVEIVYDREASGRNNSPTRRAKTKRTRTV